MGLGHSLAGGTVRRQPGDIEIKILKKRLSRFGQDRAFAAQRRRHPIPPRGIAIAGRSRLLAALNKGCRIRRCEGQRRVDILPGTGHIA